MGFMGSGKSTLGRQLAEVQGIDFFDLDTLIEQHKKLKISDIFEQFGEGYFRKLELNVLANAIHEAKNPCVIALGGGAPCNEQVWRYLNKTTTIYLKAHVKTLITRLESGMASRPLIAKMSSTELVDFIAIKLAQRHKHYKRAELTIVNDTTTDQAIEDILQHI